MKENKSERKISEYGLFKRVNNGLENNYYYCGSTLILYENGKYFDLINNTNIDLFNIQCMDDSYCGIMTEKDSNFYRDLLNGTLLDFSRSLVESVDDIMNYLYKLPLYDRFLYSLLKRVAKMELTDKKMSMRLEEILKYVQTKYKSYNMLHTKVKKMLEAYKEKMDIHFKYKVNADLLDALNNENVNYNIAENKSILLFAENNGIIPANSQNWQKLNRVI